MSRLDVVVFTSPFAVGLYHAGNRGAIDIVPAKVENSMMYFGEPTLRPGDTPIRRAIDPEHRLPDISLVESLELYEGLDPTIVGPVFCYELRTEESACGDITIGVIREDSAYQIERIDTYRDIHPEAVPRGAAIAGCLIAAETAHAEGKALTTGTRSISGAAKRVLDMFSSSHLIVVEEPLRLVRADPLGHEDKDVYTGKLRIPPPGKGTTY